jgi:hypothetical protein
MFARRKGFASSAIRHRFGKERPPVSRYMFFMFAVAGDLGLFTVLDPAASRRLPLAIEEIRVVRSIRLSRVDATGFCPRSRTTFGGAQYEDRYTFAAVTTRSGDGLVTDAVSSKVGSGHACFGPAAEAGTLNFYIEVEIGQTQFIGVGRCTTIRSDFPEPNLRISACFANSRDLADPYVGGLLTTNTMNSHNLVGVESDPPGYVEPSVATVRLWKRREPHSP